MIRHSGRVDSATPSRRRNRQSGYSFVELVITVGMILVVTTWAMPSFLSYYRSATVRGAAQTLSAVLNQGRQLAIKTNASVAVCSTSSTIQFRQTDCSGAAIPVTGLTNSSNNVRVPDGASLYTTPTVTFGSLGNASGATYVVTDTVSNRTLTVTVAASGRITIP